MPYLDDDQRRANVRKYHRDPKNREIVERAKATWVERNPEKRHAQKAVGNAIRDGHLVKGPCERIVGATACNGRVEAHHDDYSQILSVRWLCTAHHNEVHAEIRSAAR